MSYLALARKWRPRTFSQLVGQDHINQALINSLSQKKLHHAYLFTGTRGVGKTSIARLMAKSLNCELGISPTPCLQCDACIAIEQGRFIDLIEVDGASKTRIEDTRELLENVQYAPTNGRFKIYLIDEVHMLSQHSFNALLKTLEEPPEHVKFLLATTDPQKLPVTILSRCLQFNLRHLPIEVIEQQLSHILSVENQPSEQEAIHILAKAAQGSMRDALSLLDQVIASADTILTAQLVKTILGYTQQDYALQLLQALIAQNASELITLSRKIATEGGHFVYVLNQLLEQLHEITLYQNLSNEHPLLSTSAAIKTLAEQISAEDSQLFYQIALKGTEELFLAPSLNIGFEMTLLRMLAFKPAPKSPLPPLAFQTVTQTCQDVVKKESSTNTTINDNTIQKPPAIQADLATLNWDTILPQLKLSGLALNAAENAEFINKQGKIFSLGVAKGHQTLFTPSIIMRIEQALSNFYNENIKLALCFDVPMQSSPAQRRHQENNLRLEKAEQNLLNDPFLIKLQEEFSAELVKNSIAPAEDQL